LSSSKIGSVVYSTGAQDMPVEGRRARDGNSGGDELVSGCWWANLSALRLPLRAFRAFVAHLALRSVGRDGAVFRQLVEDREHGRHGLHRFLRAARPLTGHVAELARDAER